MSKDEYDATLGELQGDLTALHDNIEELLVNFVKKYPVSIRVEADVHRTTSKGVLSGYKLVPATAKYGINLQLGVSTGIVVGG